jgi:outer membrane receptor protein involved in Fe transport
LRALFIGERPRISSMTTIDAQYTFELPSFGFQAEGSALTLGAKNIANRDPPKVNVDGGYDPFAHDPRGRIWYARYVLNM